MSIEDNTRDVLENWSENNHVLFCTLNELHEFTTNLISAIKNRQLDIELSEFVSEWED